MLLFADPDFDGDPVRVKEFSEDDELESPEIIGGGDIIADPREK